MEAAEIVVIGAGIAGLAAGRKLAEAGCRVILVEARERVGGRLLTVRPPGSALPVELGAEFVHGRPPELLALLEEAGLSIFEREGELLCHDGTQFTDGGMDESFEVLDALPEEGDRSFDAFLQEAKLPEAIAERTQQYVEGFNAADAGRIGTASLRRQQEAEEEIEGDRGFRVREGYDRLAEFVAERFEAAGGELRLSSPVEEIIWQQGEVHVRLRGGEELWAAKVVLTLPLGVLQAGAVRIVPEVKTEAISAMAMGAAARLTLVFSERFWEPEMSFLITEEKPLRVWWSASPDDAPCLTGWVGGPRTLEAPADDMALVLAALESLGRVFGRDDLEGLLVSAHRHDWLADAWSRGAYSYAPAGALGASAVMAEPVEDTLYFAGEHTDTTGHWGTVHGALRSGLRAAAQVLGSCAQGDSPSASASVGRD
ncbi:flavin monoamine oxidase family protein [Silvibacterium sp.]|uniref:flavin monoamine oxidase family protein n=1 Tax=Silvibacterium sp. TaxID=1964179 RepID=UPI0039E5CB32